MQRKVIELKDIPIGSSKPTVLSRYVRQIRDSSFQCKEERDKLINELQEQAWWLKSLEENYSKNNNPDQESPSPPTKGSPEKPTGNCIATSISESSLQAVSTDGLGEEPESDIQAISSNCSSAAKSDHELPFVPKYLQQNLSEASHNDLNNPCPETISTQVQQMMGTVYHEDTSNNSNDILYQWRLQRKMDKMKQCNQAQSSSYAFQQPTKLCLTSTCPAEQGQGDCFSHAKNVSCQTFIQSSDGHSKTERPADHDFTTKQLSVKMSSKFVQCDPPPVDQIVQTLPLMVDRLCQTTQSQLNSIGINTDMIGPMNVCESCTSCTMVDETIPGVKRVVGDAILGIGSSEHNVQLASPNSTRRSSLDSLPTPPRSSSPSQMRSAKMPTATSSQQAVDEGEAESDSFHNAAAGDRSDVDRDQLAFLYEWSDEDEEKEFMDDECLEFLRKRRAEIVRTLRSFGINVKRRG